MYQSQFHITCHSNLALTMQSPHTSKDSCIFTKRVCSKLLYYSAQSSASPTFSKVGVCRFGDQIVKVSSHQGEIFFLPINAFFDNISLHALVIIRAEV